MDTNQLSFDDGLDKLEAAVQELEGGKLGLENALLCYEDGMKLAASLQQQLMAAQRKVEILRQGLGGEYTTELLEEGDDD